MLSLHLRPYRQIRNPKHPEIPVIDIQRSSPLKVKPIGYYFPLPYPWEVLRLRAEQGGLCIVYFAAVQIQTGCRFWDYRRFRLRRQPMLGYQREVLINMYQSNYHEPNPPVIRPQFSPSIDLLFHRLTLPSYHGHSSTRYACRINSDGLAFCSYPPGKRPTIMAQAGNILSSRLKC
jgi:hypothetical protein